MKTKFLFLSAIFFAFHASNVLAQSIDNYQIEKYNTIQGCISLVGNTITYVPQKASGIGSFENWEDFGTDIASIKIMDIKVDKPKKNQTFTKTTWTISKVDGTNMRKIVVYSDNYTGYARRYKSEYLLKNLPLYYFDKFMEDYSSAIGTIYTDSLVKASYKIVGISYDKVKVDYSTKYVLQYIVENSISGEKKTIEAGNEISQRSQCFEDDLSGGFHSYLSKVEKPQDSTVKYGKTTTIMEDGITKYSYVDDYIDIIIFGGPTQFNFYLKNISSSTIKIIWDDAVFIDIDGRTSKVMHSGVKYSQRENSQIPSTIIKGASLDDIVVPTANVKYSKSWYVVPMYPTMKDKNNIRQVSLMLPIQIQDVENEYVFIFDIKYEYDYPDRLNL